MEEIMGTMIVSRRTRRSHSEEFKAEVLAACGQPGVSVAEVSRRYGLNTNLVQTWRRQAREKAMMVAPEGQEVFVPVICTEPIQAAATGEIQLKIRYRGAEISVAWPVESASACAQWLREWLR
jgi:transposase